LYLYWTHAGIFFLSFSKHYGITTICTTFTWYWVL
jgi:hypothetical protein